MPKKPAKPKPYTQEDVEKALDAFRSGKSRHPELSRRTPENYSVRRANVSRAKVMNWFKNVKEYLDETNLLNLPAHRVFNCDESGFLLAPKGDKVIVRRGKKVVANVTKNDWGKLKPKSVPKILQEAMRNMNMAEVAKNGFRGCGLLPFNPLAIKKEKFLSEFPDEDVEGNDTITLPPTEKLDLSKYANTLEVLEAHLSPTVLQEFIQCEEQGFWDGNADKNDLFKFWREVRQLHERLSSSIECSGNSDVPENLDIANLPIIFENEILSTSNDDSHPDLEDVIMDEYSKGYRVDTEHFESPPPLPLEDKFCDDCDIGDIDEDLHSLTESPTLPTLKIASLPRVLHLPPLPINNSEEDQCLVIPPPIEFQDINGNPETLPVSNFLKEHFFFPKPTKPLTSKKNFTQEPSVLTSEQAIAILQEKQDKKIKLKN
ncbi:hypothetical protein DMENIID0001_069900 [Sergentomyia squamirostris]